MVRIRLCEESLVEPILRGEIRCPCHLCSGEEAIAAGLCASLTKNDYVFGNHRSHGHFLAKGGSINDLMAEIYCRENGCARGRGGSMHLIDPSIGMMGSAPIVAGTISLAMGAALASSIRGEDRVAISFFGDGATGEGVLYESMNYAALRKLPMIFACENNLYATHMPIRECRVDKNIYKIAEPFCIESCEVDGNDVLAVYNAGRKAVAKCRKGNGPFFIEFKTYRFRGHVGPDDNIQGAHTDIRPEKELKKWLGRDPIRRFERFLLKSRLLERNRLNEISRRAEEEVAEAHRIAVNGPSPSQGELTKYVFR
jgi:pyruvate dehydrogenase E1 component alpha subunit